MNPATPAAVQSAVNILLESISNENRNTLETMSTTRRTNAKTLSNLLAHADDHAEAIKLTLDSVQRLLFERISVFHTEHNKMIPLHQLPIEIFVQIITGALEPLRTVQWSGSTRLGRIVTLGQVCKHWKKAIESTASFWTTIDVLDPQTITSTAISRSACHPLNIIGTGAPYCTTSHASDLGSELDESDLGRPLDEFTNTAITLSTRWRSVQMDVTSLEEAQAIMNAPAPQLQTLELESCGSIHLGFPEGGTAFQGTEPQLRRLRLDDVAITWNSYPLRGLRYLSISGQYLSSPSCEEILGILRACPVLVGLNLSLPRTPAAEGPIKANLFALAELQSMSLFLSPSCTLALLQTIRFPSIQSVSINLNFSSDSDDPFPKLIQQTQALFSVIFEAQYKLVIDFSSGTTMDWTWEPLEAFRGGRNFKIAIQYDRPRTTQCLVENLLRRFPAESIEIHFHRPNEFLRPYVKEFDDVDSIKHILANKCDIDAILDSMSGPTTSGKWGFPELEELTLYHCNYGWDDLLHTLEAWYGTEKEQRINVSDGQPGLPLPLKRITIRHDPLQVDSYTLDSVEDIVGPECFKFEEEAVD